MNDDKETLTLAFVRGVEGPSVYLDNFRIAGRKPWGGGEVLHSWNVDFGHIRSAAVTAFMAGGWKIVPEGNVVVPLKLLQEAHAVMRECGWQLAPASDNVSGDGVLECAAAEIEQAFSKLLTASPTSSGPAHSGESVPGSGEQSPETP